MLMPDQFEAKPRETTVQKTPADAHISSWLARGGHVVLRVVLGVVYLWAGGLKLNAGLTPTRDLMAEAFQFAAPEMLIPAIGAAEILIALFLIAGRGMRLAMILLGIQVIAAGAVMFLVPGRLFMAPPHALTIEGQYMLKSGALAVTGIIVAATVRAARIRTRQ